MSSSEKNHNRLTQLSKLEVLAQSMPSGIPVKIDQVKPWIVSASRRTDLARCFPQELSAALAAGQVLVRNPFNGRERRVDLDPTGVHTLVLWSKDFRALLDNAFGLREQVRRYAQVCLQLTITGLGRTALEPGIPAADEVSRQWADLIALAGDPRRVIWRFDPLVFWREGDRVRTNAEAFPVLASRAADAGIRKVTVSLCQWYAKAERRAKRTSLAWVEPEPALLQETVGKLRDTARTQSLELQACCSPALTAAGIPAGACIDADLLNTLHPLKAVASDRKDPGQRQACGCAVSVDIGSYRQACPQGCVYCYANPLTIPKMDEHM